MPETKPTTILKIRTFADDVKRAQGTSPSRDNEAVSWATVETPPSSLPADTQQKALETPRKILYSHLSAEEQKSDPISDSIRVVGAFSKILPKELHKLVKTLKPPHTPRPDDHPQGHSAFDIRNEAKTGGAGDPTILTDRRISHSSVIADILSELSAWWKRTVVSLFSTQEITQNTYSETETTPSRRISEPRENAPLLHTTTEEAHDYRRALHASLPVKSEEVPLRQSLKTARPVRLPEDTPATSGDTAHERLRRLAENANNGAPDAPENRLMRDIPFIPPHTEDPVDVAPLRTYRNDALSDIQEQGLSAPSIAAQERSRAERRGEVFRSTPRAESSRLIPVLVSFAVIVTLTAGSVWGYSYFSRTPTTPASQSTASFFRTETQKTIALSPDRATFLADLTSLKDTVTLGSEGFLHLSPVVGDTTSTRPATAGEITAILDIKAPSAFMRTLQDSLMLGAYGTERAPFIILRVSNFETAFAGMLAWEQYLSIDLAPFFGEPVRRTYDSTARTLDQTRTAYFTDKTVQNIDVRILNDEQGLPRIVYGFINQQTLVITTTENTFTALTRVLR